ncbi:disks large-associated protein 1 [Drosophila takahashii]|uniref:disks large-associated protein 1 n=1 Tax=Drosophila takahashii TaxID=29030 RepID=UPI001CF90886|nr:disks large-associated protein 1 [Drosophila takahashii]XP_044248673.1 disks large-associated protein 1 [Drosophila takahashii]
MDRSLDSIGSCSLDVDADSSDISDTSGSLNFPTPLSVKDITRDFTANLRERCVLRSPQLPQHTTSAYVDSGSAGLVRMVLSPVVVESALEPSSDVAVNRTGGDSPETAAVEKKPSYLNLACCVNGYSNLTTYDSKIRQDINKSREVSPIRPSTSSLQYCRRSHSLAAPVLNIMPSPARKFKSIESNNNNNGYSMENGLESAQVNGNGSFIKQRVERLYGPGALAQGFYSPKKHLQSLSHKTGLSETNRRDIESPPGSELARKFKQLSPSKDYGEFRRKLQHNCSQSATARLAEPLPFSDKDGDIDLPVFRHLSLEFRAQLPTVSPKRGVPRSCIEPEIQLTSDDTQSVPDSGPIDEVDHKAEELIVLDYEEYVSAQKILLPEGVKDGNYFLQILKDEQIRLLALASLAEKYADALSTNPDITEDTFGLLRSASGKARLLVSQKMKQFEGLCHNNLNRSPEDEFPTTVDDLQGFWDMVYLQVEHVDSIFADIEHLKDNEWKRIPESVNVIPISTRKTQSAKIGVLKGKSSGKMNNSSVNGSRALPPNSAAALKRESQRKQLMEMKRQRREAMAAAASDLPVMIDDTKNK